MKQLVFILSLFTCIPVFSQVNMDYQAIDRRVQSIKFASPELLAQQLTISCTTELEKVRSIFRWIAENIDYRTGTSVNRKQRITVNEYAEDTGILKPLDQRVAESVLEKGTAVCDGYSRLFKTLCSFAGIRAELVTGYARTESYRMNQRFRSNHTWNAVYIDSVWYLLDVTWASGYISWQGNTYVRHFGEEYFLPSPKEFIREHYPDDIRWTLMGETPTIPEFKHSPFKQKSFLKYSITGYRPEKGILESNLGDTLQIEIDVAAPERDKRIGGDPFMDTSIFITSTSALVRANTITGNKVIYTYRVTSPFVQWLYLLYNDDVVLRYRLSVKNMSPVALNGSQ